MIVVCGAGGFIGGHITKALLEQGKTVRAVDIKPLDDWYQLLPEAENWQLDLREKENCYKALENAQEVYNLACDMGGMGFIENNRAFCMLSVLINTHLLLAAQKHNVQRFFFSSSACIYPTYKQTTTDIRPLKESDAYPAMAENGYGWEKLFSERLCMHFREDFRIATRIGRYHNVYGPFGTYEGGREKAPAAICRKVIEAKLSGSGAIEIWGDGNQTRSFMYIDDCLKGTFSVMASNIFEPINIGSNQLVTINQLVDIVEAIAGVKLKRNYDLSAPQGVRGRNSDNTKIKSLLGWEPNIPLEIGMAKTYKWIYDRMTKNAQLPQLVTSLS